MTRHPLPKPPTVEQLLGKRSFGGRIWAIVDVDVSDLGDMATGVNITLPQLDFPRGKYPRSHAG